jgi:hypothetical protein
MARTSRFFTASVASEEFGFDMVLLWAMTKREITASCGRLETMY